MRQEGNMKTYPFEIWIEDEPIDVIWAETLEEAQKEAVQLYGKQTHVQRPA